MTLSDTSMALLSKAAEREDRLAEPPAKIPVAARNAVFRSLIKQGLLAELPASQEATAMVWQRDDEGAHISARITDAGFRALDLDPPEITARTADRVGGCVGMAAGGDEAAGAASQAPAGALEAADVPEGAANTAGTHSALPSDPTAAPKPDMRPVNQAAALRMAAETLLAAWDGTMSGPADIVNAMEASMNSLRTALAAGPVLRARVAIPGANRVPRENTKQARVLALLRCDEGAGGPAIIEATGWAPHTVRGFLAGLKQKGFIVEMLDRVRQVSTNKPGAKGSYSVYRVTSAVAG